jgi:hypothetical protein
MKRLRNRLILVFAATTLPALALTIWVAGSLLDRSLRYSSTAQLEALSRALEETARQYYQREREALRREAEASPNAGTLYRGASLASAPNEVRDFHLSTDRERVVLSGAGGSKLLYLVREPDGVRVLERDLGPVRFHDLRRQPV